MLLAQCDGAKFCIHPHAIKKNVPLLSTYGQTPLSCASLQKRGRCGPAEVQMVPLYSEGANMLQPHLYHGSAPSTFSHRLAKGAAVGSQGFTCSAMPKA